jgi:hypothetical protein
MLEACRRRRVSCSLNLQLVTVLHASQESDERDERGLSCTLKDLRLSLGHCERPTLSSECGRSTAAMGPDKRVCDHVRC